VWGKNNLSCLTVSELNNYVKEMFEHDPRLYKITVRGELSNFKLHYSGHMYFALKDEASVIKGVMFKSSGARLKFMPQNGQKVIITGRVSVFERDGVYQIYAEDMQPDGIGALFIAYEQLKEKLSREGLFDEGRKKALPKYPRAVGVITSPTGAAVRDIFNVLNRRYKNTSVFLYPVLVQGVEAPKEIIEAIKYFHINAAADVLIIGRGGGSIEDLWAFNDEGVARAAAACSVPVISAVGHETDFTIIDYVADVRAPTPSAAAELAVPSQVELTQRLLSYNIRLINAYKTFLHKKKNALNIFSGRSVYTNPHRMIERRQLELDAAVRELQSAGNAILAVKRERFVKSAASLEALSPFAVLKRGYAVAQTKDGRVVKKTADISAGDDINLRLSDGEIECKVISNK